jgi:peptide/nickel transport system substrate-binding protein
MDTKLNRRNFLKGAAMTAVGMVAASCAQPTPIIVEKEVPVEKIVKETVVVEKEVAVEKIVKETIIVEREVVIEKIVIPSKFKESPLLSALVASGDLPPVEERLPVTPCVYPIPTKIGKYGGKIRRGMKGVSDRWGPSKATDVGLSHFDYETLGIWPDLLESWETNSDASEWTLNMREGLKWNDGAPLTSEAFVWDFENWYMNDDLSPSKGTNPKLAVTAPDDYTAVIKLTNPFPLWMHNQNRNGGENDFKPGHYLSQFHAELTEDKAALDKAISDAGFNSWTEYMGHVRRPWNHPQLPQVRPWAWANEIGDPSGLMFNERNPYFHAVDPDGNQLPYTDTVQHRLFDTNDVFDMWVLNGEIDWQKRHVQTGNFTLYKEGEAKGDYKVSPMVSQGGETLSINHDCQDPLIAEFFQNLLVRKALNVAIDREIINEIAYDGLGVPRQASLTPNSPYYDPEAPGVYAYYDPDEANRLLDEAGYDKKNSDGYRLWKDGSDQVFFTIEGTAGTGTTSSDAVLMVVQYFKDVGVNCTWNAIERSLYEEHHGANLCEAAWWGTGHETLLYLNWGNYYIGQYTDRPWAGGWGRYYHLGESDPAASPPPEGHWLWDMWEIWDRGERALTQEERVEVVAELMEIWKREVPVVGVLGELPNFCIVKNDLGNWLDGLYSSDRTADESIIGNPVLYWENPEDHM